MKINTIHPTARDGRNAIERLKMIVPKRAIDRDALTLGITALEAWCIDMEGRDDDQT